jgi:hypothetical protein
MAGAMTTLSQSPVARLLWIHRLGADEAHVVDCIDDGQHGQDLHHLFLYHQLSSRSSSSRDAVRDHRGSTLLCRLALALVVTANGRLRRGRLSRIGGGVGEGTSKGCSAGVAGRGWCRGHGGSSLVGR